MDQTLMLQRILQILQQKIQMGAGEGGRMRRRLGCKAGYLSDSEEGGVSAGVMAGKRRKARTTKKKGGVTAGKRKTTSKWITHVLAYQKKHKCSYKHAMEHARASYKK